MIDHTLVFVDGAWHEGDIKLLSARSQATYQAALVFDGARAIDGRTPDLDRHCQRVVRSARALGLEPTHEPEAIVELCQEGIARFPKGESLYIRPTYHADQGFIAPDPSSTKFSWRSGKRRCPSLDRARSRSRNSGVRQRSTRRPTPRRPASIPRPGSL